MVSYKNRSSSMPSLSLNQSNLCTPAFVYFALSILGLIMIIISNLGNKNMYTLGHFSASVPSTTLVFVIKLVYIFFWTWVLNLICRDGHSNIAWFLVLLPFILIFLIMWMSSTSMFEGMVGSATATATATQKPKVGSNASVDDIMAQMQGGASSLTAALKA